MAHMTLVDGSVVVKPKSAFEKTVMACFKCDNCETLSIGIASGNIRKQVPGIWLTSQKKILWLPRRTARQFPEVPATIAAVASEAHSCMAVNAHRAAVLLARSVIEATAKDKGIIKGMLIHKIDEMHRLGLIREHISAGAHEVRYLGNDMAHGDFADSVSREDADLVLTLMAEVLIEVYQSPARVAKARSAREFKNWSADTAARQKEFEVIMARLLASRAIAAPGGAQIEKGQTGSSATEPRSTA